RNASAADRLTEIWPETRLWATHPGCKPCRGPVIVIPKPKMKIAPDQIDSDAAKVVERLRRYDHKAYLVGGCVRDLLLGLKPKDFDVVTSATPQDIKRLFRNCRIIGRRFRLAHVFF